MAKKDSKGKGKGKKVDVYRTLSASSTTQLDEEVSELLQEKDWELYGSPYASGSSFYQAMTGKEEETEEEGGDE